MVTKKNSDNDHERRSGGLGLGYSHGSYCCVFTHRQEPGHRFSIVVVVAQPKANRPAPVAACAADDGEVLDLQGTG